MTPLDRLRLEKAAADCGFEMTPVMFDNGLEMRSAHFPESVRVLVSRHSMFEVTMSVADLLDDAEGATSVTSQGFGHLYAVLRTAAARARTRPNRVADAFRNATSNLPRSTEAERIVIQRVGQDLFRRALLDYWQSRCCVTDLDLPILLRASHIKPWASCDSDNERLDVFNGLLLSPQLDALFDAGLVTVEDKGNVLLSATISPDRAERLGLPKTMTVKRLRDGHRRYLAFHRAMVWRG